MDYYDGNNPCLIAMVANCKVVLQYQVDGVFIGELKLELPHLA